MGKKRPPRDTDWSDADEKALAQLAPEPTRKSAAFWEGVAETLATQTGRPQRTALAVKIRAQALALAAPPAPPDCCGPEPWRVGPPTAADRELLAKWVRLTFGIPPAPAAKPRTRRAAPQTAARRRA